MSHARYLVGDVFDRMAELPDGSVDLLMTSPPFLALRSYLPADHPNKGREIGSEATPAAFLDTLLALTAEWRRLLAPHGSICVELGDTYAGSAGDNWHKSSDKIHATNSTDSAPARVDWSKGWPLAKSLCAIPQLYQASLAYGHNLLTGQPSPAGQWRVRNMVAWCRPNPPVGALGDKFRPATSYLTIACVSDRRYFDLDAVRQPLQQSTIDRGEGSPRHKGKHTDSPTRTHGNAWDEQRSNPAGAPPLDWWNIPTHPYSGKASTTHREPCGPHDGGLRTTSPDCPVHAGLPGQLPKVLRDEHAGTSESHTRRTDTDHVQAQLDGFAPTPHPTELPNGPASSDSADPACDPAATRHSNPPHRTDLAPSTSPAGTPSARTARRIVDIPVGPALSEPRPGTPASRTSEAVTLDSPTTESPDDTAGNDTGPAWSEACSCSFSRTITESTSHYATFPPALCVKPILAMCPQRVCTTCGEPSTRIVGEATYTTNKGLEHDGDDAWRSGRGGNETGMGSTAPTSLTRQSPTLGWSDCGHNQWRNGLVLDPFAGSGTTLAVATGHGRDAIGIDLDPRNAHLAAQRVGMFLDIEEQVVP